MQGFSDILPRSDTECRLSLGFLHGTGFEVPPQQPRPLPAVPVPVQKSLFVYEASSASNRSFFPKAHAGCSIPCSSARWPCIS